MVARRNERNTRVELVQLSKMRLNDKVFRLLRKANRVSLWSGHFLKKMSKTFVFSPTTRLCAVGEWAMFYFFLKTEFTFIAPENVTLLHSPTSDYANTSERRVLILSSHTNESVKQSAGSTRMAKTDKETAFLAGCYLTESIKLKKTG